MIDQIKYLKTKYKLLNVQTVLIKKTFWLQMTSPKELNPPKEVPYTRSTHFHRRPHVGSVFMPPVPGEVRGCRLIWGRDGGMRWGAFGGSVDKQSVFGERGLLPSFLTAQKPQKRCFPDISVLEGNRCARDCCRSTTTLYIKIFIWNGVTQL